MRKAKLVFVFCQRNDYKKISTGTLFAQLEFKQNRLYWLVSKQCSSDSSKYESCSEEEEISVSEEEEIQTEEIFQRKTWEIYLGGFMECFHVTSRRSCWCPQLILRESSSFIMQTFSFVLVEKQGY